MSQIPGIENFSNFDGTISHLYVGGSPLYDSSGSSETRVIISIDPRSKLETCLRAINSELLVLGYPAVVSYENEQPMIIVDQLAHGMARLLNSYLKNLSQQNELATKLRSAEADLTQVQKMYRRCQEDLNESHKAIALARERDRRAEEEKRAIQLRLRATTDEVRKLQLNFQRYETQSAHERRKLENELVAMRERLLTTIVPRPGNVANNISHRSSKGRSQRTSVQVSSVVTLDSLSDTSETTVGLAPAFNSRPSTRVVAKPTRTLSSIGAQNPGQKSERCPQDTIVTAATQKPSQIALYTHLIQSLQEREHTLLYENRELRDLVSQISSRLVRFSHFVDQQCRPLSADKDPVSNALSTMDEFDSLDEEDDDTMSQSVQRESSDDEFPNRCTTPSHSSSSRRKSSNVNQLLLQLPYPLVRERLAQRVRQLSKELWRRLKQLSVTPETREAVGDLIDLQRLGEFSRGDSTNTPSASEKPTASAPLMNNTRLADGNQPQSDAENQDPEKMSNEIKTLKELVREYEGRMQKQEVALRHALFTNMRRWNSCARDTWGCPTDENSAELGSTPTHSLHESHTKVAPLHLQLGSPWQSTKTDGSQLPKDGAGDCINELDVPVSNQPKVKCDARDCHGDLKSHDLPVSIQRDFRRKTSDWNPNTTDTVCLAPAHATFTSSPFPNRARALSLDGIH
ncbi:hypothetical protein X801_02122 [Opisthorchis viverrini]|uniref:Afadin-and alpha-actinin-binding protein n=1 Tax=Opisthorchis viverrini TaxID=6198 RepID=A0A1S8X5L4_OPIVI|nr:hypothetical protein X801_02122 [Opisthorchis viverrini]